MKASTEHFDTDVLVVGAGPMGATTALALALSGIRVRVINKYNWVSITPRAHITNIRAMEVMRALGTEAAVKASATPWESMGDMSFSTSLAGREIARLRTWGTGARYGDYRNSSPCTMLDIPQSLLEPILVDHASRHGAVFSFGTEYLEHVQDDNGVTVVLKDRASGNVYKQRAQYLVGADGAKSKVLQDLGLPIEGIPARDGTIYAEFRGDLSRYVKTRQSTLHWILSPDVRNGELGMAVMRAIRPWDHWIAGWGFDMDNGAPDLSSEFAIRQIRRFVGDPELDCTVLNVSTWFVNQQHAPQYSKGRVLCGGDAVHRHPPSGGLGSNTCVQDAYNLGWKLAFIVKGWASQRLSESYSDERAPVGRQIVQRANQCRLDYAPFLSSIFGQDGPSQLEKGIARLSSGSADGIAARAAMEEGLNLKNREFNGMGAEMNLRYASEAILSESEEEVFAQDQVLYLQATTRPGAKLPHAWLVDGAGRRVSTLDLLSPSAFTLVTSLGGTQWDTAARALSAPYLRTVMIGGEQVRDLYLEWHRAREVSETGVVLVRPDGIVAWRALEETHSVEDATEVLRSVFHRILGWRSAEVAATAPARQLAEIQ